MEQENTEIHEYERACEKYNKTLPTLEKHKGWMSEYLVKYQGIWLTPKTGLKGVMLSQELFNPQPTDIFLATFPKSGTTWFKALIFCIINRGQNFPLAKHHPLLESGPHDCVPFLEAIFSLEDKTLVDSKLQHGHGLPSPRILATHVPYNMLEKLIKGNTTNNNNNNNKVVYVTRNPKDVLVSSYKFMNKLTNYQLDLHLPQLLLEEAYDMFCKGVFNFGPYWDHVLSYHKASLEFPKNVLFVTYENVKDNPSFWVRRLGEFLGHGFTKEEEKQGLVEEIIEFCSFESLSNLEVNKSGIQRFSSQFMVPNAFFFREGIVGDWCKHLTVEMAEHLDEITKQKFEASGLKLYC